MNSYHTILIAVDFSDASNEVATRAQSIAKPHSSVLHIAHVIEPIAMAYNNNILVDLSSVEEELEQEAKLQLQNFGDRFHIPETNQHIIPGSAAKQIHALADAIGADLIVIGSHGRSGFSLLLGSTANSVLHGSKCDVLAVRVFSD